MKKIPETDAIFENVSVMNQASDENPKSLRISIDSRAKVKIGNLSRGGKARTLKPNQADDPDMNRREVWVPFGILNLIVTNFRFIGEHQPRPVTLLSIVLTFGGKNPTRTIQNWKN